MIQRWLLPGCWWQVADRALPCTLVHQAPCAKGWQSCNTHTVSAALIELLHTSPKPQGSTTTYNQCKESVINNCKKQQTRSWALTGAWSQGYSSWGHCRAPNAQRRAGTHSTTATFCSFKMSNHCYWGFVIKASGNASTTSCAHRGCAGFVHPGDGKRWATTEKNNIIVVLESFVVPPADLTGKQCYATQYSHTNPHPLKYSGNIKSKNIVFLLQSFAFKSLPHAKHHPCLQTPIHNTEQPPMLKKKQHEAMTCKISDCYFTLIWDFFCLGNRSPAGMYPTQQLHCLSTSTNTPEDSQSPVYAGKRPRFYYYVLLVQSEKCVLQQKKKKKVQRS